MKSIISTERKCYLCGSEQWIEIHHVFYGCNRQNSDKYGLTVPLCHYCHNEPPFGIHHNRRRDIQLKAIIQAQAMNYYKWSEDDFRQIFGRSY